MYIYTHIYIYIFMHAYLYICIDIHIYRIHIVDTVNVGFVVAMHGWRRSDFKNYECQNVQQVFMEAPVHIKQVFTRLPKISNKVRFE